MGEGGPSRWPDDGTRLHLAKLLFCQGDQRRGVISGRTSVQGFEEGGLGDERFAGAGRRADEHALLGGEPG